MKSIPYRISLSLLIAVGLTACSPNAANNESGVLLTSTPEYTDFQWALMAQNSLILVPQNGYLWPASTNTNALLESLPPKMMLTLYNTESQAAFPVTSLLSPRDIKPATYVAQIYRDTAWQDVNTFRLEQMAFQVKLEDDTGWLSVGPENLRFKQR